MKKFCVIVFRYVNTYATLGRITVYAPGKDGVSRAIHRDLNYPVAITFGP